MGTSQRQRESLRQTKPPTQIRNGSCYGLCDREHRGILLDASLKGKKLAEILIHEIHKAAERVVTQAAGNITDALWERDVCGGRVD